MLGSTMYLQSTQKMLALMFHFRSQVQLREVFFTVIIPVVCTAQRSPSNAL